MQFFSEKLEHVRTHFNCVKTLVGSNVYKSARIGRARMAMSKVHILISDSILSFSLCSTYFCPIVEHFRNQDHMLNLHSLEVDFAYFHKKNVKISVQGSILKDSIFKIHSGFTKSALNSKRISFYGKFPNKIL